MSFSSYLFQVLQEAAVQQVQQVLEASAVPQVFPARTEQQASEDSMEPKVQRGRRVPVDLVVPQVPLDRPVSLDRRDSAGQPDRQDLLGRQEHLEYRAFKEWADQLDRQEQLEFPDVQDQLEIRALLAWLDSLGQAVRWGHRGQQVNSDRGK